MNPGRVVESQDDILVRRCQTYLHQILGTAGVTPSLLLQYQAAIRVIGEKLATHDSFKAAFGPQAATVVGNVLKHVCLRACDTCLGEEHSQNVRIAAVEFAAKLRVVENSESFWENAQKVQNLAMDKLVK